MKPRRLNASPIVTAVALAASFAAPANPPGARKVRGTPLLLLRRLDAQEADRGWNNSAANA